MNRSVASLSLFASARALAEMSKTAMKVRSAAFTAAHVSISRNPHDSTNPHHRAPKPNRRLVDVGSANHRRWGSQRRARGVAGAADAYAHRHEQHLRSAAE